MFFTTLLKTSIKSSVSKRGAFLLEVSFIIANNLLFFALWWIFFQRFEEIASWKLPQMTALIAISSGAFGLTQVFFGGVKQISYLILSGDLDAFMVQPQNILLHIIGSKSFAKGWGHIATALLLTFFGGFTTLYTFPLALLCMVLGSLLFTSLAIIAYSLPFWFGPIEDVIKKYYESILLFSFYPTHLYHGFLKIIMFSVIPAGIIGTIPVELLQNFSFLNLLLLLGSTSIFVGLAYLLFNLGLKKYESGNQFGVRN